MTELDAAPPEDRPTEATTEAPTDAATDAPEAQPEAATSDEGPPASTGPCAMPKKSWRRDAIHGARSSS